MVLVRWVGKAVFSFLIFLVFTLPLISAHEIDFNETKQLVDSGISCDQLSDEQLEAIGDYYMEQMHPGEQHEIMDNMMGGEGSESLRQMHINMARRLYCRENYGGMMGMMMGSNMINGMMSWGMIQNPTSHSMIQSMVSRYGYMGNCHRF